MAEGSLGNIGAWVTKKVPELVGMEEPDLVEFIMGHVRQHAPAGAQQGSTHALSLTFSPFHCLIVSDCRPQAACCCARGVHRNKQPQAATHSNRLLALCRGFVRPLLACLPALCAGCATHLNLRCTATACCRHCCCAQRPWSLS